MWCVFFLELNLAAVEVRRVPFLQDPRAALAASHKHRLQSLLACGGHCLTAYCIFDQFVSASQSLPRGDTELGLISRERRERRGCSVLLVWNDPPFMGEAGGSQELRDTTWVCPTLVKISSSANHLQSFSTASLHKHRAG